MINLMGGGKLLPLHLLDAQKMVRFVLICLIFTFTVSGWTQDVFFPKSIEISQKSKLSISGDTNINTFGCAFDTFYLEPCRDVFYKKAGSNIVFRNALLSLRNEGFNCGNKAINKDFHDLLQTKDHPRITLELTEINLSQNNKGMACVKISIAGRENTYFVPVQIFNGPTNRFVGTLSLNIRDFGLEQPKKLLGLIVIKEEIEINFDLVAVFDDAF